MALSLSRYSIRQQILIGFVPVLTVLVFLAFSSYQSFKKFDRSFNTLKSITKENLIFLEIEKDIVELQRNVLVYSYVGYQGVLKKNEFLQNELEEKFSMIEPITRQDAEIKGRYDRMLGHYKDYKEGFRKAITGRNSLADLNKKNINPLIGELQNQIDEIQKIAIAIGNAQTVYEISKIRQDLSHITSNVKLIATPSASFAVSETRRLLLNIEKKAAELEMGLNNAPLKIQTKTFKKNLGRLEKKFKQAVSLNRTHLQLVNVVLAGKAAEMNKLSDELDHLVRQRTQVLSQDIQSNIKNSQTQFIHLSFFAGAIGVFSSVLIAMSIAGSVRGMATTLSRLSKGKLDIQIPGQNRKDEIGEMAIAANEFKDLTRRIEEQSREIEESQLQLSAIVDSMADGLITIDEMGMIKSYNAACERIFGASPKETIGKNVNILMPEPYHSEHDGYLKQYHETGNKKIIGIGREVEGQRKDGSVFPMELSVSKIYLKDRKLYSGIVRDITERRAEQQALVAANAELEEFAYRTSHDLRSPLVSSIGLLNLAQKSIDSGDYDKAQKSMDLVTSSLAKLEALVKDILELSKTKNVEEKSVKIDIEHIVDEALQKFKHMDNYERLEVQKNIKFKGPFQSQRSRISLILENLISNAIKYQDTRKDSSFMKISTYTDHKDIVFEIEDNGLGIPQKHQDQMFSMFKRFHPKVSFGSGLGLYMMRKSADILNGNLVFEDTGHGSKFRFIIPIDNKETE
ncbi:MAG: PAS domain S-box protein [Alphaproteobacteria bacterium]